MAQCPRNLTAVLECRFCHYYCRLYPGLAARGRVVVHRYLVRQRFAGGGALFFPDGRTALYPGPLVAGLADDCGGLVRLAVVARRAAVVEGDADGQLVAGGGIDAEGQLPVAAPRQVAECRGRAAALCTAGSRAVLCGQGGHCDHAGNVD
ncbi:hypothetical protein D3C81_1482400 [compost metagenome]